jgi:Uma2 family endonuclease
MPALVRDPVLADRMKRERIVSGADRYDEVWEGVYVMPALPTNEHQQLVSRFASILQDVVGWSNAGDVFAGINISDRDKDWTFNYRVPDVAVFLKGCPAKNCGTHWMGEADLLIEVCSPEDESRAKIPFYGKIGVRELLIVDRDPWVLELYQLQAGKLKEVGTSTLSTPSVLCSCVVPLTFRLVAGATRPQIEVVHTEGTQRWLV